MSKHDTYLTGFIETLGERMVIIQLQKMAERESENSRWFREHPQMFHLSNSTSHQNLAAWASRNARILMGIEE